MPAHIELITTGSELLLGFTLNTHVNFIARQLDAIGLRLDRHTTVGDNRSEMRAVVAEALARSEVVLTTGGLGPTSDDCTRDVVAELLNRPLVRDDTIAAAIAERFRRRGIRMPEQVLVQALVPAGAQILPNLNGTAPGLAIDQAGKLIVLLPGPPRELKPMFEQYVRPVLEKNFAPKDRPTCRVFKVVGLAESLVEEKVAPVLAGLPVELGYCAKMGEVEVRIIGRDLMEADQRIRAALGDNIYGTGDDRLEEVVVKLLAGQTLAVAESCTGGLIANRITNISGASNVFLTGLVTYSNESKIKFLGVREETLAQHGAVSEEVCWEMAAGCRQRTGADFALATTGIAGPSGGTPEKPVGLVFIGLATPTQTEVRRHMLLFDRETFKFFASQYALDLVRRELLSTGGGLRQPALPSRSLVGRAAPSAPRPRRKTLNHDLPTHVYPDDAVFFLTICCRPRGDNQLCKAVIAAKIFESIEVGQERGDWWISLALLMPDHLHLLISFPRNTKMRKVIGDWKRLLARRLGIRWQRDFFEHRIRGEENLQEKADYIFHNPVRGGLIARAEKWQYVWRPEQRRGAVRAPRPTERRSA